MELLQIVDVEQREKYETIRCVALQDMFQTCTSDSILLAWRDEAHLTERSFTVDGERNGIIPQLASQ